MFYCVRACDVQGTVSGLAAKSGQPFGMSCPGPSLMNLAGAESIFSQAERVKEEEGGEWTGGGRGGLCNKYLSCDLCTERREEGGLRREDEEGDICVFALIVCVFV